MGGIIPLAHQIETMFRITTVAGSIAAGFIMTSYL